MFHEIFVSVRLTCAFIFGGYFKIPLYEDSIESNNWIWIIVKVQKGNYYQLNRSQRWHLILLKISSRLYAWEVLIAPSDLNMIKMWKLCDPNETPTVDISVTGKPVFPVLWRYKWRCFIIAVWRVTHKSVTLASQWSHAVMVIWEL